MKRFAILFFTLFLALGLHAQDAPPQPVKLLTIGNSFATDSAFYLDDMARAGGVKMDICRMNLGGHSLEQHASYINAYEVNPSDPRGSPYRNPFDSKGPKISLRQALEKDKWQYVTIQQVSTKSYFPETYEPFAKTVIDYVRKYAPQAEILILETWSYRQDHPFFKDGDLDQQSMYARLHAAYRDLGARHGLRIIPIGTAFQSARKVEPWKTFQSDPAYDYSAPKLDVNPKETGGLNLGWLWVTDSKTGKRKFVLDAKHANIAGRFLAAATVYEMLTGKNVEQNTFVPPGLPAAEAAQLRKIAHDTLDASPTAKAAPTATP
jgi:hypothetical protein